MLQGSSELLKNYFKIWVPKIFFADIKLRRVQLHWLVFINANYVQDTCESQYLEVHLFWPNSCHNDKFVSIAKYQIILFAWQYKRK